MYKISDDVVDTDVGVSVVVAGLSDLNVPQLLDQAIQMTVG